MTKDEFITAYIKKLKGTLSNESNVEKFANLLTCYCCPLEETCKPDLFTRRCEEFLKRNISEFAPSQH